MQTRLVESRAAHRYALQQLTLHKARVKWAKAQITQEKLRRLQHLLAYCKRYSPWYQQRFKQLDVERVTLENFCDIPPMTKADLMNHWDSIVTDRQLTLAQVENIIAQREPKQADTLSNQYNITVSGGSSGKRGVYVFGLHEWTNCYCATIRTLHDSPLFTVKNQQQLRKATVAAPLSFHMTSSLTQNFTDSSIVDRYIPVTESITTIVDELNALQPHIVQGYPSIIAKLAHYQVCQQLSIQPQAIISMSEPLFPETRRLLENIWPCRVFNIWACAEMGPLAISCGLNLGMHLCEDLHLIEPVTSKGQPVLIGQSAHKVYASSFFNKIMPLVRYELDDEVTLTAESCPCGSQHLLVTEVGGRSSDHFIYQDNIVVHPIVFRTILAKHQKILEYQIKQTSNGAEVYLLVREQFNAVEISTLQVTLSTSLLKLGVLAPTIKIIFVNDMELTSAGKIRRYIPCI